MSFYFTVSPLLVCGLISNGGGWSAIVMFPFQPGRSGKGKCEQSFKVPTALLLPTLWWSGLTQIATSSGDGATHLAKTQGFLFEVLLG